MRKGFSVFCAGRVGFFVGFCRNRLEVKKNENGLVHENTTSGAQTNIFKLSGRGVGRGRGKSQYIQHFQYPPKQQNKTQP